jgi:serine/threonine protein kinase
MVDSKKKNPGDSSSITSRRTARTLNENPPLVESNKDDLYAELAALLQRLPSRRVFTPPNPNDVITTVDGDPYTIGQKLGSGSFGDVFACEDIWGNSLVAKVIKPHSGTYETDEVYNVIKFFWDKERWLLDLFRHPNITHIIDAFECEHTFYLIMERCDYTVAEVLEKLGGSTSTLVPHAARDILHALHRLHKANFVHKDIHPGNVFLSFGFNRIKRESHFSCFKVGDLGIGNFANLISIENTRLAEWMLPPERLVPSEFSPEGADPKLIDIYHTGLLLLFLAYGQEIQFSREEIAQGIPRRFAENLPPPFNAPIARALRRHTKDRTPSVIDFWIDIQNALHSRVTPLPDVSEPGE